MLNLSRKELIDAIKARHSVRSYIAGKVIEQSKVERLTEEMNSINETYPQLSFRLVLNEPKAFSGFASYGQFKGVENYLVIAGEKGKDTDVICGREGEKLVLLAQWLGLNTCWVGLTYKKVSGAFEIPQDNKIRCVIALGYGENQMSRAHKVKSPEQVSNLTADSPEWFRNGIEMALLAPTAINQQKFRFDLTPEGRVKAKAGSSLAGYTRIDLGIAITHFLIGADKDESIIDVTE